MITLAPVTPVHSDLRPGSWPALLSTNVNSLEHRSQTLISSKVNYQSWAIINTASDLHHLHQHHRIVHQITYFIPVPATLDPDPFNILNTVLHLWWDTGALLCVISMQVWLISNDCVTCGPCRDHISLESKLCHKDCLKQRQHPQHTTALGFISAWLMWVLCQIFSVISCLPGTVWVSQSSWKHCVKLWWWVRLPGMMIWHSVPGAQTIHTFLIVPGAAEYDQLSSFLTLVRPDHQQYYCWGTVA